MNEHVLHSSLLLLEKHTSNCYHMGLDKMTSKRIGCSDHIVCLILKALTRQVQGLELSANVSVLNALPICVIGMEKVMLWINVPSNHESMEYLESLK